MNLEYSLGLANQQAIGSFTEFEGLLLANYSATTIPAESGILVNSGYSLFDDVSLSPRQVIFSSSPVVSTDTDYEYYTSKGAIANDFERFKRYRLHYDRPTRTLYRQRYTVPEPNDWEDVSPAPLCGNVSRLTITNINQESFEVELLLEKNIDAAGKKKEYKTNSKFTPAVP